MLHSNLSDFRLPTTIENKIMHIPGGVLYIPPPPTVRPLHIPSQGSTNKNIFNNHECFQHSGRNIHPSDARS